MRHALVYKNRKMEHPWIWLVTTTEDFGAGVVALVRYLDRSWEVYADATKKHQALLEKALAGEAASALRLLEARSSYEYESWLLADLQNGDHIWEADDRFFKKVKKQYGVSALGEIG